MQTQLEQNDPKAPYEKNLNASKIRENSKLRLRKDKLALIQKERRFQTFKESTINDDKYKINPQEIESLIDSSFLSTYNLSQNKIEFLLQLLSSQSSPQNSSNINYNKFIACQLSLFSSTLKNDDISFLNTVDSIFTLSSVTNIISMLCQNNQEPPIIYEVSKALTELTNFSRAITFNCSVEQNISRIFQLLVFQTNNYPIAKNLLKLISNCLSEPESFGNVIQNTKIMTYTVEGIVEAGKAGAPLVFIETLFWSLNIMINEQTISLLKNEIFRILPHIQKYLINDINSTLFLEALNLVSKFVLFLEKTDVEKDDVLHNSQIIDLISKYIDIKTDDSVIHKIFDIYTSMTYLDDDFIEEIVEHRNILSNVELFLDQLVLNPIQKKQINIIINSLAMFLFNLFTSNDVGRYICQKTTIIKNLIVIFSNRLVCREVIDTVVDTFYELTKSMISKILVELICIDFPKIVLVDGLNDMSGGEKRMLNLLHIVNTFLTFGEGKLSNGKNFVKPYFDQIGIRNILEKMSGQTNINKVVSEQAERIYDTFFKFNN